MTQIFILEVFLSVDECPPCAGPGTIRLAHACVTHRNTEILRHRVNLLFYSQLELGGGHPLGSHSCGSRDGLS